VTNAIAALNNQPALPCGLQGIKRHSEAMNAGDAYPLFAAMLTQKTWEEVRGGGWGGGGGMAGIQGVVCTIVFMVKPAQQQPDNP
jgi:hypothetical protein